MSASTARDEVVRTAARTRDDVLAIVSHDLRTPLAAIRCAAELIGGPRAAVIERSVDNMTRLLDDLLDVASIETGTLSIELRVQRASDIVEEVRQQFAPIAQQKGIDLTVGIADELPAVAVDRERIVQVLGNLVANAIKFTPASGVVRASVEHARDGVEFAISDSGAGISADVMTHIFDRYWHAKKNNGAGHGLGLSIAKGIVEAHGSALRVTSETGRGSTFAFTLPAR